MLSHTRRETSIPYILWSTQVHETTVISSEVSPPLSPLHPPNLAEMDTKTLSYPGDFFFTSPSLRLSQARGEHTEKWAVFLPAASRRLKMMHKAKEVVVVVVVVVFSH